MLAHVKELVKGIRNLRTEMDVPPSRKAKVFIVSEDKALCETFESMKKTYQNLISASEVDVQSDKAGIGEDAGILLSFRYPAFFSLTTRQKPSVLPSL